ncbi:RING finger protein unkempt -like protein [Babesia sp. Xinjiang]|uniref:RING finger protein unkempt -like protein n=1 Tax=Babesia sp. Xinjiang TaxID=462227 RepID=UPI000A250E0B|nr:RING finger protein unkempt -like protein [Babesia sp. Xinjiang]XP_028872103.1 RING finger protein unkempt -like protein [Babesia sp. Xinjiang]ORM41592.1 RING finger protein unkempt -like protein [Babesia sp. Xinjiang]ORM41647.1 RING finger protein unkempt -like protein [Babesia sp. Xinjiang]
MTRTARSNVAPEEVLANETPIQSTVDVPPMKHVCLNAKELEEFRTNQCPNYVKGLCRDSNKCDMSHSETWPRRNPSLFKYDYKLCPNIQFFRVYNKMQLQGKCHYGRRCRFSHSKEEQLYHPDLYKTRMCLNYPDCKGYFCPFAHSKAELRERKDSTALFHRDRAPRGHRQPASGPRRQPRQEESIQLDQTYYASEEPAMKQYQSQMITDAMQYLYSDDYNKGVFRHEINSLNTTAGSPGTLSTTGVSSVMDFDLHANLGETLRLNGPEYTNMEIVNNYYAQMAYNVDNIKAGGNAPSENEDYTIKADSNRLTISQSHATEDDEGDGWLDVVLQRGLRLLSEEDPSADTVSKSMSSARCVHCGKPQEMCNDNDHLANHWWI